jgi:hypothetical protein
MDETVGETEGGLITSIIMQLVVGIPGRQARLTNKQ